MSRIRSAVRGWAALRWAVGRSAIAGGAAWVAIGLVATPSGHAAILAYVSEKGLGEGAAPVAPQETITLAPGAGDLHLWILSDEHLAGVSLDLTVSGTAIRLTDATIHNPASGGELRWRPDLIRHGTVSDAKVRRIEGGALVGLTGSGRGIGPPAAATDGMVESPGGFLFATISYVTEDVAGSATVELSIGHNLFADDDGLTTAPIYLGPGDGPVANTAGTTGNVADLLFTPSALPTADFDSDGRVAGSDFTIWQRGYGLTTGAARIDGDATGDGMVDASDYTAWAAEYGQVASGPTAQAVPEPGGAAALLGGLFFLCCLRRAGGVFRV